MKTNEEKRNLALDMAAIAIRNGRRPFLATSSVEDATSFVADLITRYPDLAVEKLNLKIKDK